MIDAHFHVWQLARGDYGWLTPALMPIYRDVSVTDWECESAPCGITGGVLVQAAPTEAETAFLLDIAKETPSVLGVVGWVDMLAPDVAARVEALARHRKLKGLRPMLQDIADPDWILQPAVQPALAAMAACGLVFDALVKAVHLPRIERLAQLHPQLRIVVDHGAKPAIGALRANSGLGAWALALDAVARNTHAVCKLSGLWTEASAGAPVQAVADSARHLLGGFGPDRVLWGSDWPVLELAGDYGTWHAFAQSLVPPEHHHAVFEANARKLYRL